MSQAGRVATPMTVAEFRRWADRQSGKWELVDGYPRAMVPTSFTHGLIQARAAALIERHIEETCSPCRAMIGVAVIPAAFRRSNVRAADLVVTGSPPAEDGWEVKEPLFILEVLSPSNEQDTRGNVRAYMTIPSVRLILLLASTKVRGEVFERREDGTWPEEAAELSPGDVVRIGLVGFSRPLREFYARIRFALP